MDIDTLLEQVWEGNHRKMRLLAAACCRLAARHSPGPLSSYIDTAERVADDRDYHRYAPPSNNPDPGTSGYFAEKAGKSLYLMHDIRYLKAVFQNCQRTASTTSEAGDIGAAQRSMIRCVCGVNCFGPLNKDPEVFDLAMTAYKERLVGGRLDPERLMVLADAMEERGYPDILLRHLRQKSNHYRGCHAVDAVLVKGDVTPFNRGRLEREVDAFEHGERGAIVFEGDVADEVAGLLKDTVTVAARSGRDLYTALYDNRDKRVAVLDGDKLVRDWDGRNIMKYLWDGSHHGGAELQWNSSTPPRKCNAFTTSSHVLVVTKKPTSGQFYQMAPIWVNFSNRIYP